ncbi:MAG: DnaJ domain-containing protein [Deltaproteobacteria bacterium]|nr:DnaJ domain-containing protein [Deltaproteobacteria bacterium]
MELDLRRRVEVETVFSLLEELDHYRILRLKPGAPLVEVERSFGEQSQMFHPDRFYGVRDPKLTRQVTQIFKRVSESYQILKDPELKRMYDKKLGVMGQQAPTLTGSHRSLDKAALERERDADPDSVVSDKRARKYWDLAVIAKSNEDWNGVVMNVQFAMNYEKDNPILQKELDRARILLAEKKKKNQNPYKIKIV